MWHKSFLRISSEQKFVYTTLQALERNELKYRSTRLFVTASHIRIVPQIFTQIPVTIMESSCDIFEICWSCPWKLKFARNILSKCISCPWHLVMTILKQIARDMDKCPWQFSKSGNVTGKKISREKNNGVGWGGGSQFYESNKFNQNFLKT